MLIRLSLLVAGLVCLVFSSACTKPSLGDPRPVNSSATTTSSPPSRSSDNGDEGLPFAGAPEVNNPLDTFRYEQDPCRSLTAEQAQSMALPSKGTLNDEVALSTACDWYNRETRGEVQIAFIVDDPRGLSPEYEAKNSGRWEFFEELPAIEGYPAVARGIDDRENGHCTVVVGVADDMAFATILQLSQANVGQKDPCEVAVQIAGMALQTMKKGQ
jgi:hypothetical protein